MAESGTVVPSAATYLDERIAYRFMAQIADQIENNKAKKALSEVVNRNLGVSLNAVLPIIRSSALPTDTDAALDPKCFSSTVIAVLESLWAGSLA